MNKNFRGNKNYSIVFIVSFFIVVFIYLFSSFLFVDNREPDNLDFNPSQNDFFKIVKVIDGDTIIVRVSGEDETIRLIGINTPEIVDPRRPVECFGMEASNKAKEMLSGKFIRLEKDSLVDDKDKYGRSLRYVFFEDGTNFGKIIIQEGYAYEYSYENKIYKYQEEFQQAEDSARKNKRGLWADGVCKE
ncbi:thermonuclease family protein [Patescibacteria group bacterium]|nr:thermonuclease family protein [Patescibacteria group bacterium]